MALYKYSQYLQVSRDHIFDVTWEPAALTPQSGIYRCAGCGLNITAIQGNSLPPQNHHQHSASQGQIRWQLIVTH